jgi:ABC-type multidrug transport system fused ATPase/permease subunit
MRPPPAPSSRLLISVLRPERSKVAALGSVLAVGMLLLLVGPLILGRFVDEAAAGRPIHDLTKLALLYLVVALVAEALQLVVVWGTVSVAWRAGNRLRERLADHALSLDLAWHGNHSAGVLIERIDGDIEALVKFVGTLVLDVFGNVVLVAGVLVVSVFIDWRAALVLTVFSAGAMAVMVGLRSMAVPAHDAEREAKGQLLGDIEERLGGLEDLRANGAGRYAVHRLHVHSARTWRVTRHAAYKGAIGWGGAGIAFSLGSVATLATGVVLHSRGVLSVGAVLALFRLSQMLRHPLEHLAEQLKEFQKALAGAARAARLLNTEPTVVDGTLGSEALPPGALSVDLDGVTMAYEPGQDVLHNVDLHVAPGTHLGLIGRTGSGKTTVGRLLVRFWDTGSGAVRVGGVDVRDLRRSALRRRVAVVTQDVELLRASLRDNLTLLGAVRADDERLLAVLGDVGLGDWLASLPYGLDSVIAGAGALSAGEAQLLAFARAFLAEPDVVVLDEPSSRLDPLTETRIAVATHRLLAGRTAVIVAHRLATLDEVDEIAVLEGGRLVEHGPRHKLAADPRSRYARLRAAGEVVPRTEEQSA